MQEVDLTPLKPIIEKYAKLRQSGLLPALHAAQKEFAYLPPPVVVSIGRALGVPLVDVYGVIEFYEMFTTEPSGQTKFQICSDPICAHSGADDLFNLLCSHAGIESGSMSSDGMVQVERVPCLGLCAHAPALQVDEVPVGNAAHQRLNDLYSPAGHILEDWVAGPLEILTANCRKPGRTGIQEYMNGGGYQGLRKALGMNPGVVIAEVKESGLMGRGGAAFPTGVKWEAVYKSPSEVKYVVCNGDEAEPGSFKDRILLEKDPHCMLEGLIIAAHAVGAHYGYIYVRGEYGPARTSVDEAVSEARDAGFIGKDILGSGFDFEVEVRQGAGAYICGEETALFESIEGKRGFPRMKPPFPTTHGLFGKPTVINNVETLANIPYIVNAGAPAFTQIGSGRSTGPKLFSVAGDVNRPGLFEVPFGITLRELIYDLAGGIPGGKKMLAVLLGGAAGAFAVEEHLDTPMTFDDMRHVGLTLGSGAVMVFDESRDMRDILFRVARFFAHESCGKCYPCQIGTQRQVEILERVAAGETLPDDELRLLDVGWTMTDASLCGLGQTAAAAVISAMKYFPDLVKVTGKANNGRGA
jgi:NADH-quinone oxidoreductase subunit F